MSSILKEVMRGSLRANSIKVNNSGTRGASSSGKQQDIPGIIYTNLEDMAKHQVVLEDVEETFYVPLRVLFDVRDDGSRFNLRFEGNEGNWRNADGSIHPIHDTLKLVVPEEQLNKFTLREEGMLTFKVKKGVNNYKLSPFIDKFGKWTGDYLREFIRMPEFVSFKPLAVKTHEDKIDNKDEE